MWIVCGPTKIQGRSPGERKDMKTKKVTRRNGKISQMRRGAWRSCSMEQVILLKNHSLKRLVMMINSSVGVELLTGQENGRPRRERRVPKWMAYYVAASKHGHEMENEERNRASPMGGW
ncbi:hypothetical protein E2C01_016773 [Portunus trituberculatus]|uniref:Uncharacterized protein n=1 Tax=Portunus trituberculatus TaxID=210409 RepID=A0A5B7DRP8_PORTR|nr:hypothetical protein [Portunus trituberculatus]